MSNAQANRLRKVETELNYSRLLMLPDLFFQTLNTFPSFLFDFNDSNTTGVFIQHNLNGAIVLQSHRGRRTFWGIEGRGFDREKREEWCGGKRRRRLVERGGFNKTFVSDRLMTWTSTVGDEEEDVHIVTGSRLVVVVLDLEAVLAQDCAANWTINW